MEGEGGLYPSKQKKPSWVSTKNSAFHGTVENNKVTCGVCVQLRVKSACEAATKCLGEIHIEAYIVPN